MTALSTSLLSITTPQAPFLSAGSSLKPKDQCLICVRPGNLSSKGKPTTHKKSLTIQASGERGGSSGTGIFIGGFILGGIVAGTLGCVYAPQISKALAGADRKDLMRKLPKFIYDEEKALEVGICYLIYHPFKSCLVTCVVLSKFNLKFLMGISLILWLEEEK
ncbi:hypothetical protein NC651_018275 [Populus alba x Populus x berolinensis]|nr:hypothetical protein NC651_018275 [Populus alba x Populus x berolinensis]